MIGLGLGLGLNFRSGGGGAADPMSALLGSADIHLASADWDGVAATLNDRIAGETFNITDIAQTDGAFDSGGRTTPSVISTSSTLVSADTGENATIAFRYRAVATAAGRRWIAAQNGSAADTGQGFAIRTRSATTIDAQFGNGTTGVNTADVTTTQTEFVAVLLVIDTSNVTLNSNGTSVSSARPTGNLSPGVPIHLFRRSDAATGYDNGRISDLAIWPRALTTEEQATLVAGWGE